MQRGVAAAATAGVRPPQHRVRSLRTPLSYSVQHRVAFSASRHRCNAVVRSQWASQPQRRLSVSAASYCASPSKAVGATPQPLIIEEDYSQSDSAVVQRRYYAAQESAAEAAAYRIEINTTQPDPNVSVRQSSWLRSVRPLRVFSSYFLPVGFPASVRTPDYRGFYSWLFIQNVAGSTSYIMSMEALLHAVGVSSSALGWAAAASWVLKDGLGSIGMIFAAKILGDNNKFDADTLRAKWRADVAHNLGVSFELMTLLFPALFLPLASLANTLKGIAGLTNGACRASINRHLAVQNNLGDVTAKGHAQGLAAYLTGLGLGVGLDSMIPALTSLVHVFAPGIDVPRAAALWAAFTCLAIVHVACSYMALRAIALRSLNVERTSILFDGFIQQNFVACLAAIHSSSPAPKLEPTFPTPLELRDSRLEPIIAPSAFKDRLPKIKLGSSIADAFPAPIDLKNAVETSLSHKYLVGLVGDTIHVVLHRDSTSDDVLAAFFTSFFLQSLLIKDSTLRARMPHLLEQARSAFSGVRDQLTQAGWNLSEVLLTPNKLKHKAIW